MRIVLLLLMISACATATSFEKLGTIKSDKIREASGMDFSRRHQDTFWVHNDSDDDPKVFAVSKEGKLLAEFTVETAVVDWEDISVGRCLGGAGDCLYIADTGNKKEKRNESRILMLEEPAALEDGKLTVKKSFSFVNVGHNFESLAFNEKLGVFYLLDKRGPRHAPLDRKKGRVTLFTFNPSSAVLETTSVFDFTEIAGLANDDAVVTAADFDANRDMLLIGTYGKAFEIKRAQFPSFAQDVVVHELPSLKKAEAMAYAGQDIWVTSEGKHPPLYRCRASR